MLKFLGVYDYTVILTFLSLVSATTGITLASDGRLTAAVLCLVLSGLCDAFDGTIARTKKNRTEDEKAFGIQLDSLCDMVSFGVFPAVLCYHLGVSGAAGCIILNLYCVCGAMRLSYFNVQEAKRQRTESGSGKAFHGLPITSASIILPITYVLRFFLTETVFMWLLHGVLVIMAFLFILDFRVPKPDYRKLLVKLKILRD